MSDISWFTDTDWNTLENTINCHRNWYWRLNRWIGKRHSEWYITPTQKQWIIHNIAPSQYSNNKIRKNMHFMNFTNTDNIYSNEESRFREQQQFQKLNTNNILNTNNSNGHKVV